MTMVTHREKVLTIREESRLLSSLRAGEQGLAANKHAPRPISCRLTLPGDPAVHLP